MLMWHFSLHDSIDTPLHMPRHTRLLRYPPPFNRFLALGCETVTTIITSTSFFKQRTTLWWKGVSTIDRIIPHPAVLVMAATGRHPSSLRDYDKKWLQYEIRTVQDEFDHHHHQHDELHKLCTMGDWDGSTSLVDARVWYHEMILWPAGRASCECDHHMDGNFQELDESPLRFRSTVLPAMEPRIQAEYKVVDDANTLWEKLTSAYKSMLKLNIFKIREDHWSIQVQDRGDVTNYSSQIDQKIAD